MSIKHSPLTSSQWLASHLNNETIVTLDATFFLPQQKRNAVQEFAKQHIPGARFFDVDQIADQNTTLPHMLPTKEQFSAAVGRMGIDNDTHVVVYDNNSFMASARIWWTFRIFGHKNVTVLDGGLKHWIAEKHTLTSVFKPPTARKYKATFNPSLVVNIEQMLANIKLGDTQIIDARSSARFCAIEPEPREGLRSGHMPGSLNLPSTNLLNKDTGKLHDSDKLKKLFQSLKLNFDKPVITSCGSGVTASILTLGLYCIGKTDAAVYDGSWTEWGSRKDTPVMQTANKNLT